MAIFDSEKAMHNALKSIQDIEGKLAVVLTSAFFLGDFEFIKKMENIILITCDIYTKKMEKLDETS